MLPKLAADAGIDVLHSLASIAPGRGSFARVVTIHDVIYRIHPEAHGWRTLALRGLIPLAWFVYGPAPTKRPAPFNSARVISLRRSSSSPPGTWWAPM